MVPPGDTGQGHHEDYESTTVMLISGWCGPRVPKKGDGLQGEVGLNENWSHSRSYALGAAVPWGMQRV